MKKMNKMFSLNETTIKTLKDIKEATGLTESSIVDLAVDNYANKPDIEQKLNDYLQIKINELQQRTNKK